MTSSQEILNGSQDYPRCGWCSHLWRQPRPWDGAMLVMTSGNQLAGACCPLPCAGNSPLPFWKALNTVVQLGFIEKVKQQDVGPTMWLITYYQLTVIFMAEEREGGSAEFMAAQCCGGRACSSAWISALSISYSKTMALPVTLFSRSYYSGTVVRHRCLLKGTDIWELCRRITVCGCECIGS